MRWLVAVVVLVATTAYAQQPKPELTKEFQAGVDAFRLGKFDEAKGHLEKARDLDPKLPGPHRFLAAVAQAQGRWQDCIDGARKALEVAPLSPEAPETKKLHDDCRTQAGRTPYRGELGDSAAVAVTTNIPGATVKINGLVYGGTPLAPRPITAGELEIEIAKPGWKAQTLKVPAPAGIVTDVIVDLETDPNAQVNVDVGVKHVDKATTGALSLPILSRGRKLYIDGAPYTHSSDPQLAPGEHLLEMQGEGTDRWRRRVRIVAGQKIVVTPDLVDTDEREATEHLGLALVAAGGALLAGGFVTALVSEHAANDAREIQRVETARDPANPGTNLEPLHTRADFDAARDRSHAFAIVSDITFGAALVTAGVGAYFLYKGAKQRTDIPPPFYVAPATGGVVVGKEVAW
jgi:tetratricopeptide (TPR) repeat protein